MINNHQRTKHSMKQNFQLSTFNFQLIKSSFQKKIINIKYIYTKNYLLSFFICIEV